MRASAIIARPFSLRIPIMPFQLLLTGDINLMNVEDPRAPFARAAPVLKSADARFANLECCFYAPQHKHSVGDEGLFKRAMRDALGFMPSRSQTTVLEILSGTCVSVMPASELATRWAEALESDRCGW